MIDTHTHIYTEEFDSDRSEVVNRAKKAGISHLILPNIDVASISKVLETAVNYPSFCSVAMGLHPTSVTEKYESDLKQLYDEFLEHEFCAIGEVGIDLFWDKSKKNIQQKAFATQIEWALAYDLPIIIHSRNAFKETYEVLQHYRGDSLRGVFHCFEGTLHQADRVLDMGFYIGVNGCVTFKNSQISLILQDIPLSKVLLETDAPYLAPTPFRGKRNEPSFLEYIVEKIADIYAIESNIVEEKTQENAQNLFKISN